VPGSAGTHENTNGLVWQYLPKGDDLTAYSHDEMTAIQSSLNDRPRKRLDYLTPAKSSPSSARQVSHLKIKTAT
jgi:IS30 family transposase